MKALLLISALALLTGNAMAFPEAPFDALKSVGLKLKSHRFDSDYDFEGIVKLSNCSGALIKFSGQPSSSSAYVLTNGHCVPTSLMGGMLKPGEVISARAVNRNMKIFDKNKRLFSVVASKVSYATMTDTDLALYQLTSTYEEIARKSGIEPFELDTVRPMVGTDIDIVSGYWDKGYSCAIDTFVFGLKESGWTFKDSIRYTDGCDTIGGTSGSPLIARGTRKVIGVNNTANFKGENCTVNNPCEVSRDGKVVSLKDKRYGQQTYTLYTCLRPDYEIDIGIMGCELPKPLAKK